MLAFNVAVDLMLGPSATSLPAAEGTRALPDTVKYRPVIEMR
jgi:hypothetical protein